MRTKHYEPSFPHFMILENNGGYYYRVVLLLSTRRLEKMSKTELLKLSVEKWLFISFWSLKLDIAIHDGAARTCPLCRVYFDWECDSCPVANFTQAAQCVDTPYVEYSHCRTEKSVDDVSAIAIQEAMFLVSLIPTDGNQ